MLPFFDGRERPEIRLRRTIFELWPRNADPEPLMSQDKLFFPAQLGGCLRWGLCDTGGSVASAEEVIHVT